MIGFKKGLFLIVTSLDLGRRKLLEITGTCVFQRDQLGTLVPGRTSIVTPGSLSVRAKFHQVLVESPPPPQAELHRVEHAYP